MQEKINSSPQTAKKCEVTPNDIKIIIISKWLQNKPIRILKETKWKITSINVQETKANLHIKSCYKKRMAHTCNSSNSRSRDQVDLGWKPARVNSSWDPIEKKPFTKKGWWGGSMCRPRDQAAVPQKKKKERKEWNRIISKEKVESKNK
jgi:hypothetical protein